MCLWYDSLWIVWALWVKSAHFPWNSALKHNSVKCRPKMTFSMIKLTQNFPGPEYSIIVLMWCYSSVYDSHQTVHSKLICSQVMLVHGTLNHSVHSLQANLFTHSKPLCSLIPLPGINSCVAVLFQTHSILHTITYIINQKKGAVCGLIQYIYICKHTDITW